jgi:hypothetical protein
MPDWDIIKPALKYLSHLLYFKDEDILQDACWALSYMSDGPSERLNDVVKANIGKNIVKLLAHPSSLVQTAALRVIGNIVTGDDTQTQYIINLEVLPKLKNLLRSDKLSLVREACWTISNIAAGNHLQIQAIIKEDIFPRIIALLYFQELEILREAIWSISNSTSSGNPEQIRYLVNIGLLEPFCSLLTYNDAKIVIVVLEGIENILKAGKREVGDTFENPYVSQIEEIKGIEKIEDLQKHKNMDIYNKAVYILETYFQAEDDIIGPFNPDEHSFNFSGNLEEYKF